MRKSRGYPLENGGSTSRRFPNEINAARREPLATAKLRSREEESYRKPRGGAPKGNRNRLRHGLYSAETLARHATDRALLRQSRLLVAEINAEIALRRAIHGQRTIYTIIDNDPRRPRVTTKVRIIGGLKTRSANHDIA